jgi:hypothetical protein
MANQTSAGVLSALFRVAKRVTIVFLTLVMVVVGFLALLMVADKYHWGWTEVSILYRFSFGVEVGDVPYTGATVVQIAYTEVPRWQAWAWIDSPAGGAVSNGEPAAVRLPGGKVLCLMVQGGIVDGKKEHHNSLELTSLLLGPLDPSGGGRAILHSSDLKHLVPSVEIPLSMLPTMLIFDDFNNPKSAHIFDPQRPDQ